MYKMVKIRHVPYQPAVSGGIDMHLMQKMGWKQREGLGITKQGGVY